LSITSKKYFGTNSILARRVLSPDGQKSSLLATIGPADRPGVVLSAHTDVVPTEGQSWSVPPFGGTIRDDRIYGRGATDMKGFIAVVLAHLPDFIAAARNTPIHRAFSYDEEVGCRGAPDLIRTLMQAVAPPALAIVGEPTAMRVVRAHKGKLSRRLTVTGRAGHSAMPHRAANAGSHSRPSIAKDRVMAVGTTLLGRSRSDIARYGIPMSASVLLHCDLLPCLKAGASEAPTHMQKDLRPSGLL
jgi:acetylornithine deacetylase